MATWERPIDGRFGTLTLDGNENDSGVIMDCFVVPEGRCAFQGATGTCTTVTYEEAFNHAMRIGGMDLEEQWIKEHYPPQDPHSACTLMADLGLAQNRSLDGIDHRWVARERFDGHPIPITPTGLFLALRWRGAYRALLEGFMYELENSNVGLLTRLKLHAILDVLDTYFFDGTLQPFILRTRPDFNGNLCGFLELHEKPDRRAYAIFVTLGTHQCIRFFREPFEKIEKPWRNREEYPTFPVPSKWPARHLLLHIMQVMAHEIVHFLIDTEEVFPDHGPLFNRLSYFVFGATHADIRQKGFDIQYRARLGLEWQLRPGLAAVAPMLPAGLTYATFTTRSLMDSLIFKLNLARSLAKGRRQAWFLVQLAPVIRDVVTVLDAIERVDPETVPPHVRVLWRRSPPYISYNRRKLEEARRELEAIPPEVMAARPDLKAFRALIEPGSPFMDLAGDLWTAFPNAADNLDFRLDQMLQELQAPAVNRGPYPLRSRRE